MRFDQQTTKVRRRRRVYKPIKVMTGLYKFDGSRYASFEDRASLQTWNYVIEKQEFDGYGFSITPYWNYYYIEDTKEWEELEEVLREESIAIWRDGADKFEGSTKTLTDALWNIEKDVFNCSLNSHDSEYRIKEDRRI